VHVEDLRDDQLSIVVEEGIMPKLKSIEDLKKLRDQAQRDLRVRTATDTRITVGMGTCGIAAGARETLHAILMELHRQGISAHVMVVDCIGMCSEEPLVDIEQAGRPRITYCNVVSGMVPREWTMGGVPSEGSRQSS
jgi:NADP-reducing hydrogenase subunit HndB